MEIGMVGGTGGGDGCADFSYANLCRSIINLTVWRNLAFAKLCLRSHECFGMEITWIY